MAMAADAVRDLDEWLKPFLDVLGRKTRRSWAPLYVRGLLGPGERKSLQPMAVQLGLGGHDQLQHFIASPAWDDGPLWTVLAHEADRLIGGPDAVLVIDDTALPKKGTLSVGVARQYCGQLGKRANCQALVSLTLAGREVPIPVGLRLFLPQEWTSDPARCAAAGVPDDAVIARGKGAIALAEVDRLRAAGVRFGTVLADAGYGASAAFRHGLDARGLRWAVGIPRTQKVYDRDVRLPPPAGRKRRPVPDQEPQTTEAALAGQRWRRVSWRGGTKGSLSVRFACGWATVRRLPATATCPARKSGYSANGAPTASKYYLSNLPPRTSRRALARAIKARWVCEQAHQQLKQELGLGHFEGRSWTGLHRHALLTCIAFAYLQHRRLAELASTGPGKNVPSRSGTATIAQPAGGAPRHHPAAVRASRGLRPMSALQTAVPAAA